MKTWPWRDRMWGQATLLHHAAKANWIEGVLAATNVGK